MLQNAYHWFKVEVIVEIAVILASCESGRHGMETTFTGVEVGDVPLSELITVCFGH